MEIIKEDKPTREFYYFLRYNRVENVIDSFTENEENFYQEFVSKWISTMDNLKKGHGEASMHFGAIASMFGFSRHFCSISGLPILGKYQKIGNRIVSEEAFESYKIIQQLDKQEKMLKEDIIAPLKTPLKKEEKKNVN